MLATKTVSTAQAARKAVDDGDAAVAVIVPEDFSAVVSAAIPRRRATSSCTRTRRPRSAAPSSRASSARCSPTSTALGRPPPEPWRCAPSGDPPRHAVGGHSAPSRSATRAGSPPACRSRSAHPRWASPARRSASPVSILAGMMVFFMFFGAANVARSILTEDRDGTMPRLFTTPTRRGTIIAGKFVSTFLTVLAQAIVLLDRRASHLQHPLGPYRRRDPAHRRQPPAWRAASPCSSFRSPGRRRRRAPSAPASTWSSLCWAATSPARPRPAPRTRFIQQFTPNGWLLHGWDTAMRGGGAADIRWQALVPLGFAVAFFFFAVLKMRRRFA